MTDEQTTTETDNTQGDVVGAKVYLASGWFTPAAAEELTQLEEIFDKREWIDLAFYWTNPIQ